MLKTLRFSASEIGILLGIIEVAGACVPFLITPQLDRTGRYGTVMCIFGLDIALLLVPLLKFHSFFVTAASLAVFAVGFKGLVPVLDGFTAKALRTDGSQYGKIRALGSAGFVCTSIFLQFSPLISGRKPASMITGVGICAFLFVASLCLLPDLQAFVHSSPEKLADTPEHPSIAFSKPFWECLLLILLAFLGLVPCQRFFSLYVEEYIGIETSAGLWALSAMAEIPIMIISGKLIQRFGKERLLAVCLCSIVVRNCCYVGLHGISGAIAGQLLHSISFGLFYPLSVLLCVSHSLGRTATAMTFFTAVNGIANVIGSMTGGYIIEYAGYPALFLCFSVFPFIGIGLYFYMMRRTTY